MFIDESGLLMAPLVRRSWAPRGQTPLLYQRTRTREKVSVIAALWVSPKRRHVALYFTLAPNTNVNAVWSVAFLRQLARHIRNPIIVIWDRLKAHRSRAVRQFVERSNRIHIELLPPYAPELNPVELLWCYLKCNPLANLAAVDAEHLSSLAHRQACLLEHHQDLLRSFIHATALSSCLE